jgi:hypothetical protein
LRGTNTRQIRASDRKTLSDVITFFLAVVSTVVVISYHKSQTLKKKFETKERIIRLTKMISAPPRHGHGCIELKRCVKIHLLTRMPTIAITEKKLLYCELLPRNHAIYNIIKKSY